MKPFFIKVITTFFFTGYFPLIPGTFVSVIGLLIYVYVKANPVWLIVAVCITVILGFSFSGRAAAGIFKHRDPPQIVIDEVSGILISFLGVPVKDIKILLAGFFVFRILDTVKLFPANRFQRLPGSLGIMGDDIIAAIYTNIFLQIIFLLK